MGLIMWAKGFLGLGIDQVGLDKRSKSMTIFPMSEFDFKKRNIEE